jgi:hypothetical protein
MRNLNVGGQVRMPNRASSVPWPPYGEAEATCDFEAFSTSPNNTC